MLVVTALVLVVLMVVTWAISLAVRDASIVDIAWGAAIVVVAGVSDAVWSSAPSGESGVASGAGSRTEPWFSDEGCAGSEAAVDILGPIAKLSISKPEPTASTQRVFIADL